MTFSKTITLPIKPGNGRPYLPARLAWAMRLLLAIGTLGVTGCDFTFQPEEKSEREAMALNAIADSAPIPEALRGVWVFDEKATLAAARDSGQPLSETDSKRARSSEIAFESKFWVMQSANSSERLPLGLSRTLDNRRWELVLVAQSRVLPVLAEITPAGVLRVESPVNPKLGQLRWQKAQAGDPASPSLSGF